jgi:hypothetical protein
MAPCIAAGKCRLAPHDSSAMFERWNPAGDSTERRVSPRDLPRGTLLDDVAGAGLRASDASTSLRNARIGD